MDKTTTNSNNGTTRAIGNQAEHAALKFLQQQGLELIAQNWTQARVGEIDLIMLDHRLLNKSLVFIEVRFRTSSQYGGSAASISSQKQQKIIKTAQYFLAEYSKYTNHDCRFDVIAIDKNLNQNTTHIQPNHIDWIEGAFLS